MPEHDRSQYPYACMNMAVLQANFDCIEEALPAINEAISAAREAKDHNCLLFCLSWLYHFNSNQRFEKTRKLKENMLGSDHAALAYLKQQAKENELPSLEAALSLPRASVALAEVISLIKSLD